MRIKQFFDEEFKLFSQYDCVRSIPNVIDGFKPSQRKIIFGMLKRGESAEEIKVENAANYIASVSDYHHGANSLIGTIANMAQNFSGSNNINFLMPNGQFGSRLDPAHGAGRYIFTEFSKSFREMFKKADDAILEFQFSDDMQIEPKHYLPLLPTVLINGASGTGTGYASNILNYNPEDIKADILAILNNKKRKELVPFFKGFKGKVSRNEKQTVIEGSYTLVNSTTIRITELPIGTYQDDFKTTLNKLQDSELIKDWSDSSTEDGFDFTVSIPRTTGYLDHEAIMKTFKLITKDTENFTAWGHDGKMKVFETPSEIVTYFVDYRLNKYEERRLTQIANLEIDLAWANEKLRFIKFYIKNSDQFAKKNKIELKELLDKNKFVEIDRLLQIRIYSLTADEIAGLEKEIDTIKNDIAALKNLTNKEIYLKELNELKFK